MQPGVTMRADIMHPHRRREDACHLSERSSSGQQQYPAPSSQPKSVSGLGKLCSKTGSPRFAWMKARDEILFFLIFGGGDSYIVYPFRFIMEFMTFTLCPVRFIYFILKILRAICVRLFGIEETYLTTKKNCYCII